MTREEQEHYEKLAEHYNSKKDEIKPNPELWSIQDATDILIKQGLMKRVSETDMLDKIRAEIEKPLREERFFDTANAKAQAIALRWCIEIIDKYRGKE